MAVYAPALGRFIPAISTRPQLSPRQTQLNPTALIGGVTLFGCVIMFFMKDPHARKLILTGYNPRGQPARDCFCEDLQELRIDITVYHQATQKFARTLVNRPAAA